MSLAQEALSKITRAGVIPASQTDYPVSGIVKMNEHGALNYRLDVIVGKVVVAAAVSAKLQHSSGYNLWVDLKSASITASTDKTISGSSASADTLTVTGHGFVQGQAIIFTQDASGLLPQPLVANQVYYADVVDANTIKVLTNPESKIAIDLTAAATGTNHQVTGARVFSIKIAEADAADTALLPLKNALRCVVTTGAGDSVQIADILSIQ